MQNEGFTLHTFGFGTDVNFFIFIVITKKKKKKKHDPELMRDLAKIKDGNFYYIENLKAVDSCFLDALGGLVSLVS